MQKVVLAIAAIIFSSGCASIIKGTDQTLTFSSEPSGAEVIVDGISQGKTPLVVKLKKNQYQTVMIKKSGYDTIVRPIEKTYDGVALLNVFWDCSTTDLITGAAFEYQPNSYHFTLEKGEDGDAASSKAKPKQ